MRPDELEQYGYILIFLGTLIEGDATLITASFLAHQGRLSFTGVLLTAGIASTLANEFVYYLSRKRSRQYFERKLGQHPKYRRMQEWMRRRSSAFLLCSRYIFGFRLAIPAVCGMTGMSPPVFTALNVLGAALWVLPLGYAGYAISGVLTKVWAGIRQYEWHIALALLAIGWTLLVIYDPELRMVANLFFRTRGFALREFSRIRHMRRHRMSHVPIPQTPEHL